MLIVILLEQNKRKPRWKHSTDKDNRILLSHYTEGALLKRHAADAVAVALLLVVPILLLPLDVDDVDDKTSGAGGGGGDTSASCC